MCDRAACCYLGFTHAWKGGTETAFALTSANLPIYSTWICCHCRLHIDRTNPCQCHCLQCIHLSDRRRAWSLAGQWSLMLVSREHAKLETLFHQLAATHPEQAPQEVEADAQRQTPPQVRRLAKLIARSVHRKPCPRQCAHASLTAVGRPKFVPNAAAVLYIHSAATMAVPLYVVAQVAAAVTRRPCHVDGAWPCPSSPQGHLGFAPHRFCGFAIILEWGTAASSVQHDCQVLRQQTLICVPGQCVSFQHGLTGDYRSCSISRY
jgi:hypothetical protein